MIPQHGLRVLAQPDLAFEIQYGDVVLFTNCNLHGSASIINPIS
jgi:hypothetical protein